MSQKSAQLQISFAWLFAIIVGAFVLFLAIYGVTKLISTEEEFTSARTGREIGVLLNPLETGFEEGKSTLLEMPEETRIHNKCSNLGNFGLQSVSLSQKSFGKWAETDIDVGFENKYIFSENIVQDKNFFLFSKPLELPFKVSDLIYLTSSKKNYCFIDAPEDIEDEISDLNQENLFVENCPEESIDVCFSSDSGCDILVNENLKSVEKTGKGLVYYEEDALMYAAIFSDKDVYECQSERLVKRLRELSNVYNNKATILSRQGCVPEVNLASLISVTNVYEDSSDLIIIKNIAEQAETENNIAECQLW